MTGGLDTLTPREREVLELVAEGLSNTEIGERLGTEVKTVKTHLGNLYQKLHVSNRTQAAAVIWRARMWSVETELDELRRQIDDMQPELKALTFYLRRAVRLFEGLTDAALR